MSNIYGRGVKGKATKLHAELVRARGGGVCERCGRNDRALQCAHIVSRRYAHTRCDLANAWALCHGCHSFLTQHPWEHVVFAHETLGEAGYAALRERALSRTKVDWEAVYEALRTIHDNPAEAREKGLLR